MTRAALCFVSLLTLTSATAFAVEREQVESLYNTTRDLINMLVEQGVLPREKADALIREAERRNAAVPATPPAKPAVRVPYVPEVVKNEIREQIKQEVLEQAKTERWGDPGVLPEWIGRLKWEGDIRLRMATDIFDRGNAPVGIYPVDAAGNSTINLPSTQQDRDRLRVRARLGVLAQVTDDVSAGIRITTGNTTDPVSTNQTLGNSFARNQIVLDRAYLKIDPAPWFSASGGRIANPWFGTDLVWDDDLNFEGVAATFKPRFNPALSGFLTLGAFPLQESALSSGDKWLYAGQIGGEWNAGKHRAKLGVAYYDFHNYEGRVQPAGSFGTAAYGFSSPQFRQRGNSLMDISDPTAPATSRPSFGIASKFRVVNATGLWDYTVAQPVHVVLSADYARNLGYDRADIAMRAGVPLSAVPDKKNKAYLGRLAVGMPELIRARDWQVFGGYRYVERDAVVDAFTDSDFHAGGTDAKGYFLGASYGVRRNTWLSLRWLSTNEIDGPRLGVDTLHIDLNARF